MAKMKTVMLFTEWKEPLSILSLEQKGKLLDALLDYPDSGAPKFDEPLLSMAWAFMDRALEQNKQRYNDICEKRSEAGKRGNEKRWGTAGSVANVANAISATDDIASVAKSKSKSKSKSNTNTKSIDTNVSNIEANASKGEAEKKTDVFTDFANGDGELLEALKDFEEMRKRIKKPMTDKAKKLICNKLKSDYSPADWIAALNQSIENSWQGLYPLKDKQPVQSNQAGGYDAGAVIEAALKNIDRKYGI